MYGWIWRWPHLIRRRTFRATRWREQGAVCWGPEPRRRTGDAALARDLAWILGRERPRRRYGSAFEIADRARALEIEATRCRCTAEPDAFDRTVTPIPADMLAFRDDLAARMNALVGMKIPPRPPDRGPLEDRRPALPPPANDIERARQRRLLRHRK